MSYIRTDSVRISDEARVCVRDFIVNTMGEQYYGNNVYKNRKKDVQDAHEAIRPSYVELEPESVKESLSRDQYKLVQHSSGTDSYASQMAPAKFKALSVVIANGDYDFKANGSKMLFDGFLKVYSMSKDDEADRLLPDMEKGEVLQAVDIECQQNFTHSRRPGLRSQSGERSGGKGHSGVRVPMRLSWRL